MILLTRPSGQMLRWPTNTKLKCIELVNKGSGNTPDDMWSTAWDWTFQQTAIDKAVLLGANAVKFQGSSVHLITGGEVNRDVADHQRQALDYCRSQGLAVYWQMYHKTVYGTEAEQVTMTAAVMRVLRDYTDILVAVDLWNEPDAIGNGTASQVASFAALGFPAARAVTAEIPLTISLTINGASDWLTSAYYAGLVDYVDFWDFHAYYLSTTPQIPATADVNAFRSAAHYKPFILGEVGAPLNPSPSFEYGPVHQRAFYTALGDFSRVPDCMGVVAFCMTDYDAGDFGFYTLAFAGPRSQLSDPFSAWRDVR